MIVSYHISHEQFPPRELLALARHAESAGFEAAFSSDHFNPWSPVQGHSGFLWSWLGAALQATREMKFSAITVPGGWRHHPVVTAQAIATTAALFPRRLPWIALGSGEALNEFVVGRGWPSKWERNARLREAAALIRALLAGETVSSQGHLQALEAKIWSLPAEQPKLFCAALSAETAQWAGQWADGLLTVARDGQALEEIVAAFRHHGAGKPVHIKVDISWAPTESQALGQAHQQWKVHALSRGKMSDLRTPQQFEDAAESVQPDDVRGTVFVSADLQRHAAHLQEFAAHGVEWIDVHNVGVNQREFIDAFGERVLPTLSRIGQGSAN